MIKLLYIKRGENSNRNEAMTESNPFLNNVQLQFRSRPFRVKTAVAYSTRFGQPTGSAHWFRFYWFRFYWFRFYWRSGSGTRGGTDQEALRAAGRAEDIREGDSRPRPAPSPPPPAGTMIDLSFLTEQERETILSVLQRDTQLKKAEERRVRGLQRSVKDKGLLKYLSGEWFYETKSRRHQDRIHGGDIVRASIRPKHRPLTLLEKSQRIPEKPSFVASDNRDVHVPPELCDLIQEDLQHSAETRSPYERPQETPKENLQSPTKLRKNPFNSEPLSPHTQPEVTVSESEDPCYEEPFSPELLFPYASNPDPEMPEPIPEESPRVPSPVPIYRRNSFTHPFYSTRDRAGEFHYPTPRGILKGMSDPGFEEPPISPVSPQTPLTPLRQGSDAEDASPAGRDPLGKQVRFGPATGPRDPQQAGKEAAGEHGLLDAGRDSGRTADARRPLRRQSSDGANRLLVPPDVAEHQVPGDLSEQFHDQFPQASTLPSTERESGKASYLEHGTEEEAQSQARAREWFKMGSGDNVMSQSAVEDASDIIPPTSDGSKKPSHTTSPAPSSMLVEMLSKVKAKDNGAKEEDSVEELADISVQPWMSETRDDSVPLNHQINPAWDRSQQSTASEKSMFVDSATSSFDTGSDPQLELTESQDMAQKLSDLKAFWEGENSGPKVIFAREQVTHDDTKKDSDEDATHDHAGSTVESPLPRMEMTRRYDTAQLDDEMVLQENESCNNSIDLPKEDGTYRARPILINDETDESLAGSVKDFQDNSPSGTDTGSQLLPEEQSCPQEDKLAKLTDLGVFWEKEYSTPKIIVTKFEEPSSDSHHSSPDKSEELFPPTPDLKEETENNSIVSNPKPMIGKGFVTQSLGKSHLSKRSHESESSLSHDRPLSPVASQSSPLRDCSDDELRRSPSKTCHPKVLVRESSLPRGSIAEGSPLKTFPIDLALQPKDHKEEVEKPTPRLKTGLSHEAMSTESTTIPSEEIISRPLPPPPEDSEKQSLDGTSKMSGTSTPLVRSLIPDGYQHYLGSPETAHLPPFEEEQSTVDSTVNLADTTSKTRRPLRRQGATSGKAMIEGNHSRIRSWIAQNAGSSSHKDKATSARSQFRSSSGSYDDDDDDSSPVRSAPNQRPISMSHSMENLGARTERDQGQSSSQGNLNVSLDEAVAVAPSAFLSPDPLQARRMSKSVPALGLEEVDGDRPFGTKPRRRTASVVSDVSISSGLASMSSISGSVTSINQGERDVEVQGTMQFAVNYVQKLGELQIFVVQCRDLALAEPKKSRSDPYVKCYLVPDKTKLGKRKTSVKKRTLNPSYNEILRFKILMEVLKMQRLNISVWHNDTFGRNSFLGEIALDLSDWDFGNTEINEYTLSPRALTQFPSPPPVRSKPTDRRGQMRVALRYLAQQTLSKKASKMGTGEVQIWVKDCKDLPPARGVIIDPFVKCTVLPDTSKKSRQKTRVVKRTTSPMFNHTMVYDGFRPEDLREACAEITVWDHDRLNNHLVGGLRLGLGTGKSYGAEVDWMDSLEPETNLWEKMMRSDGEWVEDVLPLRTFVVAKSMAK